MNSAITIWLADDDPSIRWVLERALRDDDMTVRAFETGSAMLDALEAEPVRPQVLLTDIRMPGVSGLELLEEVGRRHAGLPVIVTTAHSDLESAVSAYGGGAFEYLPKPFDVDEVVALVRRAAAETEIGVEPDFRDDSGDMQELIGQAPAMQEVFRAIGRLAKSSMTVLITGESGTGKELVAQALHRHSPRSEKTFIALNTSAIPAELLESELFGHEKGAFTGATERHRGRFEQADGGTLFLDEIGDMSAALQTRLLRVLAEGEFFRVGGQQPVRVDVRVLAATNKDLAQRVSDGEFREDLFHRLNVIQIRVPSLRDRREDIPELLANYLRDAAQELQVPVKKLDDDVVARLTAFDWPGNVRQLVNACRLLTVTAPGNEIRLGDIPDDLGGTAADDASDWQDALSRWARERLSRGESPLADIAIPEVERILIREALAQSGGRKGDAAKLLGWGRNTLTRKLKDLD